MRLTTPAAPPLDVERLKALVSPIIDDLLSKLEAEGFVTRDVAAYVLGLAEGLAFPDKSTRTFEAVLRWYIKVRGTGDDS